MLSKTYTLKITNSTQGARNIKIPLDVEAQPIRIVSQAGDAYQIIDDKTGLAPHKVLVKKVDNDLYIRIEDEGDANIPDIIIDNYYDDTHHVLVGEYKPGHFSDYVADVEENAITTMQIAAENQEGWFHLTHETNDNALLGVLGGIGIIAAAAGGGGGEGNHAPVITSDGGGSTAAVSASENQETATDVNATDSDGDTITYSIVGGEDSGKFTIDTSTGVLSFTSAPNYENPGDFNSDNAYVVIVQASDGKGGIDTQTITINVTDANDAPIITSNGGGEEAAINVPEDSTPVTTVTATDADVPADTLTFSIVGGADAAKFTINSSTGELSFITAPNYEEPTDANEDGIYHVNVQVADGHGGIDIQTISITVTDANFAPVITSNGGGDTATISVAENTTAVTTVTATDADQPPDTLVYDIIGGADSNRFVINSSTGALSFNSAPNYEAPFGADNSYEVIVQVYDGHGGTDIQTITVNVTDANDAPIITSNGGGTSAAVSIVEDTTAVTTVTATDADVPADTLTYSITGGADAAKFTINSSTGALSFITAPNYEAPTDAGGNNVYDVIVQVSDGHGGTDTQAIAVTVTDGNFAPVITSNGGSS
ncbi:MAG: cadherin domain-containing protein [Acidaminococcaceae bacterium]